MNFRTIRLAAHLLPAALMLSCSSGPSTTSVAPLWFDTTKSVERTFTAAQKDTIAMEIEYLVSAYGIDRANVPPIDRNDPFKAVHKLDPYSRVYDVSNSIYPELFELQRFNNNPYGLILQQTAQGAKVVNINRTRKARLPLASGVTIVSIAGKPITHFSPDALALALYRAAGSGASIEVKYGSGLKRKMKLPKVENFMPDFISCKMLDDTTGYIRFEEFGENIDDWIAWAAENLRDRGMKYLMLDLRGNSGGVVKYILEIQKLFVEHTGNDSMIIGRLNEAQYWSRFQRSSDFTDLPIVILVDRQTASAAEALTGAMQDRDRAVVVGEQTYGKGMTLGEYRLSYDLVLLLSSGYIFLPSGRCNERPYNGSARCDVRLDLKGTIDNFDHHAEAMYINDYYQSPSFKSLSLNRQLYPTMGIIPDYIVGSNGDHNEEAYYTHDVPKWLAYQYYTNMLSDDQKDSLTYYIKADQFNQRFTPPADLMKQALRAKDHYGLHGDVATILSLERTIKANFTDALARLLYKMEYFSNRQLLTDPVVEEGLRRRQVAAELIKQEQLQLVSQLQIQAGQ